LPPIIFIFVVATFTIFILQYLEIFVKSFLEIFGIFHRIKKSFSTNTRFSFNLKH